MRMIINLYFRDHIVDAQVVEIDPINEPRTPVAIDVTYIVEKLLERDES